jgi:maltose alpha-D-glucosyltransferase/alpha-amylase
LKEAHQRGLRIITDLVMNHTSDVHPWFQAARSDRHSPFRDYYVWSKDDRKYSQARIIFLDTEKSNWTWDPLAGQYYWHRFYASQPDLNFDNPSVQQEMLRVMDFWLGLGVDGFRVDAVPYLFEREGTNCENLPETHAYLKRIRSFVDEKYPGRLLLCEANQWPQDVRAYFGESDEFHMAFHFPLMPRLFMALKKGELAPLAWALDKTPPIPKGCQWANFLRNHDELTLEMVTPEERNWMWEQYAPELRMRLNLGIRRRLAPLLDNDRRKIELAYSLMFSLPGTPFLYYGDEIGMGDNIDLPDRNGVRTPMQWEAAPGGGFSTAHAPYLPAIQTSPYSSEKVNVAVQKADQSSLWHSLRRMIQFRKQYSVLRSGELVWIPSPLQSVAAYLRRSDLEQAAFIHNLADQAVSIDLPLRKGSEELTDILTNQAYHLQDGHLKLTLRPYEYLWLV